MATPEEITDLINRVLREFRRYTGDGLPGEPTGAPLPVGDPQSGPHNPKKAELRSALIEAVIGAYEASEESAKTLSEFRRRYLGAFASDPNTDNEGDPLEPGALYFNTTYGKFRVWTGAVWQDQSTNLNDGDVTAPKIDNTTAGQAAIAYKLNLLSDGDVNLYVNASTGNDSTGDGSIGAPFATPQAAWDSLPWLIKDKYVINIANGTYATSSRAPLAMDRPALIYCDGKRLGRRTDAPGGTMTGSVTFKGESKASVVLRPGSANGYTRGIYATGHVGSVGFQNLTINAQAGAESGIVSHRGVYVHAKDIDLDGNGVMTFGLVGEAAGFMEAIGVEVHHVAIGVQCYQASTVQLSSSSSIHNCSSQGVTVPNGGYVGLTTGSSCASSILLQAGGRLDLTGISSSRISVSGALQIRGGDVTIAFADLTGSITTYPGSRLNGGAMGWSKQWTDYGADLYLPGCKSYVAPATQSDVATPLLFLGGTKRLYVDASFELIASGGATTSENVGASVVTISGSNQAITDSVLRNIVNTVLLDAAAARTGITLPGSIGGRFAGTPVPPGTVLHIYNTSANSITLAPGSTSDIPLTTIQIGTASGLYPGAVAVMGPTKWVVTPLGVPRP